MSNNLFTVIFLALTAAVSSSPLLSVENRDTEALLSLIEAFERWRIENSPDYGPVFGIHLFDHQLVSYDIGIFHHRFIICRGFLTSLQLIDRSKLNEADRLTYDVLEHSLLTYIEGVEQFRDHQNLCPLNFLETGWFSILGLWSPMPDSEVSFRAFLAVIHSWRIQGIQIENLMRRSMAYNRTYFFMSIVSFLIKFN